VATDGPHPVYNAVAMKKLAIGCGLVALLLAVAVVGVGYYGYLKVRSTVAQVAELGRIPDLEREVRIKTPFTAPASGELTPAQVERFAQVQKRVRERLGQAAAEFERNYKQLADKKDTTIGDLPTLLAAYRDMASAWMDAKRTQIQALNDAGLSLDEYRWIRNSAYQALGVPFVDLDFGRIAAEMKQGMKEPVGRIEGAFTGTGPAANLKLVERYRKMFEDNVALASFGL
jgi:hypothetical protein